MGQARGPQGTCLLSPGSSESVPELSREVERLRYGFCPLPPSLPFSGQRGGGSRKPSFPSSPPGPWLEVCGHWCKGVWGPHTWLKPTPPPPSSLRESPVPQLSPADTAVVPYPGQRAPSAFSPLPDLGTTGQESVGPVSRFLAFSLTGFWIPIAAPNSPSRLSPHEEVQTAALPFPQSGPGQGFCGRIREAVRWGRGQVRSPSARGAAGRGRQASLSRAPFPTVPLWGGLTGPGPSWRAEHDLVLYGPSWLLSAWSHTP